MTTGLAPADVPVFDDPRERDALYLVSERSATPFLAVDVTEHGYVIVYDLLPAGVHLSAAATTRLRTRVEDGLTDVLRDDAQTITELSAGVGPQLGTVAFFDREETAREFAAALSRIVFDRDNWESDESPRSDRDG